MFSYGCRVAAGRAGGPAAAAAAVVVASFTAAETATSKACGRMASRTATDYAVGRLLQRQLHRGRQQQPTYTRTRTLWTTSATKPNTTASSRTTTTTAGSSLLNRPLFSNNLNLNKPAISASSSSSFSTGPTSTNSSSSFLGWYEGHLEARPVLTKMGTGAVLWSIGDAVAQVVPVVSGQTANTAGEPFEYDWIRTGRAAVFGFVIHAPTSHVHFNFLEWLTAKRLIITGYAVPFFKAFMEQFVYWSWISNTMYHAAMGAMQGLNGQQIYDRIADVLWDTQKAQWVFWIPVQLLNFQFVPVRHQLNVVLLTSIVWTALLSAWYPPLDEKKDHEDEEKLKHLVHLDRKKALPAAKPE